MHRFFVIILLSLSIVIPAKADNADSLIVHILTSQLLPDYHAVKYCSYTTYEKTMTSLHNIDVFNQKTNFLTKYKWMRELIESSGITDTTTVPIMTERRVSRNYLHLATDQVKEDVLGIDREGVNELFDTGNLIDIYLSEEFPEFSIYSDTLIIDDKKMVSPISLNGINYYDYKITEGNDTALTIIFTPKPSTLGSVLRSSAPELVEHSSLTLTGSLRVVHDSLWRIRHTAFFIKRTTRKEHTDSISIRQNYITGKGGGTVTHSTDFRLVRHKWGFLGRNTINRTQLFSDYSFDSIPDSKFRRMPDLRYDGMTDYREADFWAHYDTGIAKLLRQRHIEDSLHAYTADNDTVIVGRHDISRTQENIFMGLDYLNTLGRGMRFITAPAKALVKDYIGIGSPTKFEISPVSSLISYNNVDKWKFRFGGTTTANLFKRTFFDGYVAWGTESKNIYYKAEALYSFIDKMYSPTEFPQRHIKINSSYNICYLGEMNEDIDHDNLFKSFQWDPSGNMIFARKHNIEMEWDKKDGIGFVVGLSKENDRATGNLFFHTMHESRESTPDSNNGDMLSSNGSINITELRLELLFYPQSKRFNTRRQRVPINNELPRIVLSHYIGAKILSGDYNYHVTMLKVMKDWYLGSFGIAETDLKAGYVWGTVAYPLLIAPPSNVSYIRDDSSFSLINPFGFANDMSVQLLTSIEMNGNIIGIIPLIKRLRWKEFFALKMLWGTLSDSNNPSLPKNKDSDILMPLPSNVTIMNGKKPYVEAAVGIHNIFHVLSVDYVFRLSYRSALNTSQGGLRFSVHF